MNKKESAYKNFANATAGQRFKGYLLDFFMCLALATACFIIIDLIVQNTPGIQDINKNASVVRDELNEITFDTKLSEKNPKTSDIYTLNEMSHIYVIKLTLKTLEDNYSASQISTKYDSYEAISLVNDNAFGYFTDFKKNNNSQYNEFDGKGDFSEAYYKNKFIEAIGKDYFETSSSFPILTKENADFVNQYIVDGNSVKGGEIYEEIAEGYKKMINLGSEEIVGYYKPYLLKIDEFNKYKNDLLLIKIIDVFVGYFVGVLIVYLLFPLIFKNGKTLGFRLFHLATVTTSLNKSGFKEAILKTLIMLIQCLAIPPAIILLIYSGNAVLIFEFSPAFSTLLILMFIFSILILTLSFCLSIINKKTHQTISEFASFQLVKDINETQTGDKNKVLTEVKDETK